MSKVTTFNRATCRTVSEEAEAALQAVADKFGLTLKRENGRFSATTLTSKFCFSVVASDGSGAPADFAGKARCLGLPEDCFGKTFTTYNGSYTITGINLRARKYPVQGTDATGKRFKFPVSAVQHSLAKAA